MLKGAWYSEVGWILHDAPDLKRNFPLRDANCLFVGHVSYLRKAGTHLESPMTYYHPNKIIIQRLINSAGLLSMAQTFYHAFEGEPWNEKKPLDATMDMLEEHVKLHDGILFKSITDEHVIAGGACVGPVARLPKILSKLKTDDIEAYFLSELWVDPKFQRKQIGSQLLKAVENLVIENGFTKLVLWTHHNDHGLHAFYRRHGYSSGEVIIRNDDRGDENIPRLVFRRNLTVH